MTRDNAVTACANLGARLPMPKTAAENQALFEYITRNGTHRKIWDLGKVDGNRNAWIFLGAQGGYISSYSFPNDALGARDYYNNGVWIWDDGTSFEAPDDEWRLNSQPANHQYRPASPDLSPLHHSPVGISAPSDPDLLLSRFWANFPDSCHQFGWSETAVEACTRYGNSCHDLPLSLQDGCLRSAHPQSNFSNWAQNQPSEIPSSWYAKISFADDGKWSLGKHKNSWTGYAMCQGVCSPPPTPPPPAPPPCDVLVLTFYNPCKCDWDKFNVSMGEREPSVQSTLDSLSSTAAEIGSGNDARRVRIVSAFTSGAWMLPNSHPYTVGLLPGATHTADEASWAACHYSASYTKGIVIRITQVDGVLTAAVVDARYVNSDVGDCVANFGQLSAVSSIASTPTADGYAAQSVTFDVLPREDESGALTHDFASQGERGSVSATKSFCIFPGCYSLSIGPHVPEDLSWQMANGADEMPLLDGTGGLDMLFCHESPYPPPAAPPSPAIPGGWDSPPPPPPSPPPSPPRVPYDPRPPVRPPWVGPSPPPPEEPPPPPGAPPVPPAAPLDMQDSQCVATADGIVRCVSIPEGMSLGDEDVQLMIERRFGAPLA